MKHGFTWRFDIVMMVPDFIIKFLPEWFRLRVMRWALAKSR